MAALIASDGNASCCVNDLVNTSVIVNSICGCTLDRPVIANTGFLLPHAPSPYMAQPSIAVRMPACPGYAGDVSGSLCLVQPTCYAVSGSRTCPQHDLGRGPCVLERVMMPERNSKIIGDISESVASCTVTFRPCPPRDPGTVQPCDLKLSQPILGHGPVACGSVERRVADQHGAVQPGTDFVMDIRQRRALSYILLEDSVDTDVARMEPAFRVYQGLPLIGDPTLPDPDNSNLADRRAIGVGGFHVNRVECQVFQFHSRPPGDPALRQFRRTVSAPYNSFLATDRLDCNLDAIITIVAIKDKARSRINIPLHRTSLS